MNGIDGNRKRGPGQPRLQMRDRNCQSLFPCEGYVDEASAKKNEKGKRKKKVRPYSYGGGGRSDEATNLAGASRTEGVRALWSKCSDWSE